MATFKPFLLLISFLALALVSSSIPLPGGLIKSGLCGLRLNVKTLSDQCAGTTSNVSITVSYTRGSSTIPNLVEWNIILPPPQGGYFQAGHLDTLGGLVYCDPSISLIPCNLNITITGTGHSPTWGLEFIEVVTTKSNHTFQVNDWLTPENNYNIAVSTICPRFSTGMSGSTKSSLAI